jgi:hypothetical protein
MNAFDKLILFACVQFLGAKTLEARDEERKEEQKVIEARIREREVGVGHGYTY